MNSLRSRQLVSAFGIIMVGILILGALLFHFSSDRKIKEKHALLEDYSFKLLGFFNLDNRALHVEESERKNLKTFLENNSFENFEPKTFAYVQNIHTKEIIWYSQYPLRSAFDLVKYQKYFLFFDIDAPANKITEYYMRPERPTKKSMDVNSSTNYEQDYIINARGFHYKNRGNFQLIVATSAQGIESERRNLLEILTILFFVSAVLVLIAQMSLSFWIIDPIKDFENEIILLETGEETSITAEYPEELTPIKNAVNGLLSYEKGQKQRYKDALDDLAHSLKTPLAAMQGYLELAAMQGKKIANSADLKAQIKRMNDIISYQLARAVVTEQNAMIPPQVIRPLLFRLKKLLKKVYMDKNFEIKINVDEEDKCRVKYDDLMEVFGNLLNNACRFCNTLIEISTHINDDGKLILDIDDDGMGFPIENTKALLQRGIRADSQTEGQGIGLAISTEIIMAVGGEIELLASPQLGARVRLHLPI